jgi:uncharacterized protein (TIRG00374 family)
VIIIKFTGATLHDIIYSIVKVDKFHLIAIVIVTFLVVIFTSWKWQVVLRDLIDIKGVDKGYFTYFSAMGMLSNNIIPHVGNYGLKAASMKLIYNIPIVTSTLSVLIEQMLDLLVLAMITIPALFFFLKIFSLEASIAFVIISAICICLMLTYNHIKVFEIIIQGYKLLYKIVSKIPFIKKKFIIDFSAMNSIATLSKKTIIKLCIYSYLKYVNIVLRNYIVILSLNIDVSYASVLLAASLVSLVVLFGFIPCSLGTQEAGWFGVLALLGVDKIDIGLFLVTVRVLLEPALVLVTLITYLFYILRKRSYS